MSGPLYHVIDGVVLALPGPTLPVEIPARFWRILFGWMPFSGTADGPTAVPVVGALFYCIVIYGLLRNVVDKFTSESGSGQSPSGRQSSSGGLLSFLGSDDHSGAEDVSVSGLLSEERRQGGVDETEAAIGGEVGPGDSATGQGRTLSDIGEENTDLLAPGAIEEKPRHLEIDDGTYVKCFYVKGIPDYPKDAYLSEVFKTTDVPYSLTAFIEPKNQNRAREALRERADDLEIDADGDDTARSSHLQRRAEEAKLTLHEAESGTQVLGMSMYIAVRGEGPTVEESDLHENARKLVQELQSDPANLTIKPAIGNQLEVYQSILPIGPDKLAKRDRDHYRKTPMAGGVGALLSSMNNPNLFEPSGIEFGKHKDTQAPIFIDPWEREDGYATFAIADPGGGKSHSSKQRYIRTITQLDDVLGFIIEPLGNWRGVAEATDAEIITIGGNKGLNPLHIEPLPEHIRESMPADASPFEAKKEAAVSWVQNYFKTRNIDGFGERRAVFERAMNDAYAEKGITRELDTHRHESPTLRDVIRHLEYRVENSEEYVEIDNEQMRSNLEQKSIWLIEHLKPFREGGAWEQFGRESEVDLRGKDNVYFDLGQSEGNVSDQAQLSMQLLVQLVYERVKTSEKRGILAMDEFRYFIRDVADTKFLETLFRHHRHYDLSPWVMTQTLHEFMESEASEAILDACSIKIFHKLDGMDGDWAGEFDMNLAEAQFIRNASAGSKELGYSDALVGVDNDWLKLEVHTLPKEFQVIEYDSQQDVSELPGRRSAQQTTDTEHQEEDVRTAPRRRRRVRADTQAEADARTDGGKTGISRNNHPGE